MTTALIHARRQDALTIAKELAHTEALRKEAETRAETSRQALERQQTEIEEKDALIAHYRDKYNL